MLKFESELDKVIIKLYWFYKSYEKENSISPAYISTKLCPRCGEVHLSGEEAMNSTSKLSPEDMNFYICNDCALPDKLSTNLEDFFSWAIYCADFEVQKP